MARTSIYWSSEAERATRSTRTALPTRSRYVQVVAVAIVAMAVVVVAAVAIVRGDEAGGGGSGGG